MKKIVILGCENTHAGGFLDFIAKNSEFSHLQVVGVYSDDTDSAKKLSATYGVPVMEHYADAVGRADGVIITARHGDKHYEFAKPYIESAVPIFIDKPITIREDEAFAFMHALKEHGTPVTGGSSLRFNFAVRQVNHALRESVGGKTVGGIVRAPLYPDSPHGGFFFYAQHLVEMVITAFGRYPKSVQVSIDSSMNRTVLFHYEDFTVTGLYTNGGNEFYAARFSVNGSQGGCVPTNQKDPQLAELREFVNLLDGGTMVQSYSELFAPVFVMNAIERAAVSGHTEPIYYVED